MAYVYNNNTTRLTGLASGMDTDSIIKNLMQIEQLKVNRELRSRTLIEWKQEALTSVKNDINNFRNNFLSTLGTNSMLKSSTYIQFTASTQDTSGAVSIAAGSANTASRVTINQVHQLATATKTQSKTNAEGMGSVLASDLPEGNNVKLGSLQFTNALEFDENGNFSFQINGETFTFNKNDTLQNMLSTVSSNEKAGAVLNYSRLSNTFTLQTKETGADTSLTLRNVTGNAFGVDGAFQIDTAKSIASGYQQGKNARVTIDGVTVEKSSNTFTSDGITYTLNKATSFEGDDEGIVFNIEKNVESAVDAIKEFVNGYNTLIKKLQGMLSEKKSNKEKGYTPLTDDEKADMTESQINQWEAIAKKGLLYNDADLRSLLNSLRDGLYESIESTGLSVSQLGLRTGNYFEGNLGEIVLDEDTLRTALEKDADQVMRVFMELPDTESGAQGGYMYRLQKTFDNYTKVTQYNALENLGKKMTDLTDRIETLETRMSSLEESYYLKFAAMEEALATLQNQSSNLAGLLGQA